MRTEGNIGLRRNGKRHQILWDEACEDEPTERRRVDGCRESIDESVGIGDATTSIIVKSEE